MTANRRGFGSDRHAITVEEIMRSEPTVADLRPIFGALSEEIPDRRRSFAIIFGLTVAEVAAGVAVALIARSVLDSALATDGDISPLSLVAAVAAAVGAFAASRWRQLFSQELVLRCRARAVERLSRRINAAPYEDLAAVPMAELREILMTDADFAYRFFIDVFSRFVVIGAWLVAAIAVIAVFSTPVLGVLAVVAAVVVVLSVRTMRAQLAISGRRFRALADLSQQAREVVEVDRIVLGRELGLRDHFVEAFLATHRRFVDVSLEQARATATLRASLSGLNAIAFVAAIIVGGFALERSSLAASELVAILFVISQLLVAVVELGEFAYRAAETAKAGRRLGAYWDAPPAISPGAAGDATTTIDEVVADHLVYAYPGGEPVVDDASLRLVRGQITGLTGATGVGKSTLGLLLTGILTPQRGTVLVDGAPPAGGGAGCLYVGPRPLLSAGSVIDNLYLDRDSAAPTPTQIARLQELFDLLGPSRLAVDQPLIGPNGTGVSSGQGQLISVARAWVRNPALVVFDEATSSLDMPTEAAVQEYLLDWLHDRICLVISHRGCPWLDAADHSVRQQRRKMTVS